MSGLDMTYDTNRAKSEESISAVSNRRVLTVTVDSGHLLPPSYGGLAKSQSLQCVHHQSSTETSGLGETVTSGCSSPESTRSFNDSKQNVGIKTIDVTEKRSKSAACNFHNSGVKSRVHADVHIQSASGGKSIEDEKAQDLEAARLPGRSGSQHPNSSLRADNYIKLNYADNDSPTLLVNYPARIDMHALTDNDLGQGTPSAGAIAHSVTRTSQTTIKQRLHSQPRSDQDFDSLFTQAELSPVTTPKQTDNSVVILRAPSPADVVTIISAVTGQSMTASALQPSQVDREWDDRRSALRSSIRSVSSRGSHRSRSGSDSASRQFLGRKTESAWLRWSRERRASVQRRLEKLEKEEKERQRVPTPVKKARQECLSFVHPDLEHKYLSEEEIYAARQRQIHEQIYYGTKGIGNIKITTVPALRPELLSDREWNVISGFWYHRTFINSRLCGSVLSLFAFLLVLVSISTPAWVNYATYYGTKVEETLWINCSTNISLNIVICKPLTYSLRYQASIWDTCYDNLTDMEAVAKCPRTKSHWQNAVIGFIIFAASFGFIGSVLSFLGLFTSTLPKKIYYYHSAGEIFLICALTSVIALIIYPVAVSLDDTIQSYRLGLGYGLGWGSAFFFVAAALCMSLDELIREITRRKLCKTCLNRGNGDEDTQRV